MTIKEKAQRVLELHTWLKESKEAEPANALWYAAEQAKAKYNFSSFMDAYQYCVDSSKFFDEVTALADYIDAAKRLNLI